MVRGRRRPGFRAAGGRLVPGLVLAGMVTAGLGLAGPAGAQRSGFEGFSGALRNRGSAEGTQPSYNDGRPPALEHVGIDQRLDQPVPLDLAFRDETGADVRLGDYFRDGKPVVLVLAYYGCPMLCTQVLNGLASSLKAVSLNPGTDFHVLTVSFDSTEAPTLAAAKRLNYLERYGKPGLENDWHFLVGDGGPIASLTDAVGFRYAWDPETAQFAHASALMVLTPEGRVSRYLFGMEFAPRDLRLALIEASQNKIGNLVDQVLLFCYHYDPATGKYGAAAMNILRLAGVATLTFLALLIGLLLRRERRTPGQATRGTAA